MKKRKGIQYHNYKISPNIFLESRPEQWFFVLVSYTVTAFYCGNFKWLIFLLLSFPYNFALYRFDTWLEDKLGKGIYEILSAPFFYMFPFILGYGSILLHLVIGTYLFYFGINATHSIGHKEINLKWAYVILPAILIGAYILALEVNQISFFYSNLILGVSFFILVVTKNWRDDYWLALFGCYVGVALAFALMIIT